MSRVSLLFIFVLAAQARAASVQECYSTMKEKINACRKEYNQASARAKSDNEILAKRSTGATIQDGGNIMAAAFTSNAELWGSVADGCEAHEKKCQEQCDSVTVQADLAKQYSKQCEKEIKPIADNAKDAAQSNRDNAAASTTSSKTADSMQGARQRETNYEQSDSPTKREIASGPDQCMNCLRNGLPPDIAPRELPIEQASVVGLDWPTGNSGNRQSMEFGPNGGSQITVPNSAGTETTYTYPAGGGNPTGGSSRINVK